MELKINFIRAALGETITADARLIHLGRRMAMGEAEITDERGKLVAAEIMGAIYRRILEKISSRPETILGERVSLSRTRKMAIAAVAYARTRFHA